MSCPLACLRPSCVRFLLRVECFRFVCPFRACVLSEVEILCGASAEAQGGRGGRAAKGMCACTRRAGDRVFVAVADTYVSLTHSASACVLSFRAFGLVSMSFAFRFRTCVLSEVEILGGNVRM